jgi:wobble nucleotide-excising tRNase
VGKYQDGINDYLAYFGCEFRIESVEPKFSGGRAGVHYKLKAHGHEIQLGVSTDEPSFETVLSEGDKHTLALSFFFARLKHLANLSGRIIVLDDPVNSLGSSRRSLIEGVIRDLLKRKAQVVVLTHDIRLAALIWRDRALEKFGPAVTLQVEKISGLQGSRLAAWDVEKATQGSYVADYLALIRFLEGGGDHTLAAKSIRPYLEQRLRYLYPGPPFSNRDSLGIMLGKIRNGGTNPRLHTLANKLADLEAINDAALPDHHAADDVPGGEPLTADGVRMFAKKALDILG